MFRMEIDSSLEPVAPSRWDLVIERLLRVGVPMENLNQGAGGAMAYAKNNRFCIPDYVAAVLPADDDEVDEHVFRERLNYLKWLMFEGDPKVILNDLAKSSENQRGVCGSVWGNNDIAYRCRTCEHDPTCAICVPCFENGNHKDHDYSVIFTGGGCCDCGDISAWKREGFCSNHKGAEQIQPLPENIANSFGPVLDLLLDYWKKRLLSVKGNFQASYRPPAPATVAQKAAGDLTFVMVNMLLDFCQHSESLLSFIAGRVYSSVGLLDALLRAESFMAEKAISKLHELLLKLLGEPIFKYEFAKVFVRYYPVIVNATIKDGSDRLFKRFPLLSTFSVQILTVPTLTPRLVEEMNLMAMLLQCLENIFSSCAKEDGGLMVITWANLYETTLRVVEDIRFVMSHSVVPKYLCHSRRDLVKTWMKLLTSVQGMNSQKRETGSHIEEENDNIHLPFVLCHSISNICSLLVGGAFSDSNEEQAFSTYELECEDQDNLRHAKVGRLSSISSITGKSDFPVPACALWLVYECSKSMENWFELDDTAGNLGASKTSNATSGNNFIALKRTLSNFRRGRNIFKSKLSHSNLGPEEGSSEENIIEGESISELERLRVLSLSDWPDITFDVSSQDISVNIPLHRFLSMVLRRSLQEYYGESRPSDQSFPRCSSDFLGQILGGSHPVGFSAFVMEHPLRIRVFCAQVHAGMWRRNGDAPILFSEWYRSVRWSEQGQELDLFLLQCCAALAPPDLYVNRIMERYGLANYLSLNPEHSTEHEPVLVTEMLTLIIQIVKERRYCGLTASECLQRELVYKLSVADATRSQIVKSLPRDLSKIEKIQEILDIVAEYSHPSGMNQGMYKLRPLYWKELDLYHPRWSSRELQAAEERYSRFCNVSASSTQLPKWKKIYDPLKGIAKISTCKTLLEILRAVLFYAVHANKRAPDGVLLTALHLLALSLDVCRVGKESGDVIPILAFTGEEICTENGDQSLLSLLVLLRRMYEKENADNFMESGKSSLSALILSLLNQITELEPRCRDRLQKLAPELADQFSNAFSNGNKGVGSASDKEKLKTKARDRQAAIMEKMRAQQSKFLESCSSNGDENMDDTTSICDSEVSNNPQESAQVICSLCHDPELESPISYLVLLQKSRLLSFVGNGSLSWEQGVRSGKEHVSNSTTETNDIYNGSDLVDLVQCAVNDFASVGQPSEVNTFIEFIKARFPTIKNVQLPCVVKDTESSSSSSSSSSTDAFEEDMYLLMRKSEYNLNGADESSSTSGSSINGESVLLGKYIASLPKETLDYPSASQIIRSRSNTPNHEYDKFGSSGCDGIYVSSCGHAVHQQCLDRYLSSVRERYTRRIVFEGGHIVDPDQGEFLCPVCRGLANSLMPTCPENLRNVITLPVSSNTKFTDSSLRLQDGLSRLQTAANVAKSSKNLAVRNSRITPYLEPIMRLLCGMYYPGHDKILETGRVSPLLILWDTLKYSLISAEIAARSRKSSMSPNHSLGALYKELNSSSGFILSLILHAVQVTRKKNSSALLLKLRGIQLFAKALCSTTSSSNDTDRQGGNMLYILENCESEVQYPDTQLLRRVSEPVLACDTFSSLMWCLFCLPWPVLACKESFMSFVHVFYVVTVTQAVITICRKNQSIVGMSEFQDSLISDIFELTAECVEAVQCFDDSYYVDPTYDINDSIRSLTSPYLRRCALLWKLINCSNSVPFNDGFQSYDPLEFDTDSIEEIHEVKKMENLFEIPPLDVILNDKNTRVAALRWIYHLVKAGRVVRCNPAVPFKLMVLPHLYQDLLQRYIKKPCPDCGAVKEEPALCLLCGKLCSPNWKTCCRESGSQTHATACGAGIGVFLLIRRTTILLQRSARQAPWPSPYLDAFGEEDVEMGRGKPLFLNEERYAALTHMVASQGLDRSSKVLRQTTTGSFFIF